MFGNNKESTLIELACKSARKSPEHRQYFGMHASRSEPDVLQAYFAGLDE
jgi:hypothetical protein